MGKLIRVGKVTKVDQTRGIITCEFNEELYYAYCARFLTDDMNYIKYWSEGKLFIGVFEESEWRGGHILQIDSDAYDSWCSNKWQDYIQKLPKEEIELLDSFTHKKGPRILEVEMIG